MLASHESFSPEYNLSLLLLLLHYYYYYSTRNQTKEPPVTNRTKIWSAHYHRCRHQLAQQPHQFGLPSKTVYIHNTHRFLHNTHRFTLLDQKFRMALGKCLPVHGLKVSRELVDTVTSPGGSSPLASQEHQRIRGLASGLVWRFPQSEVRPRWDY